MLTKVVKMLVVEVVVLEPLVKLGEEIQEEMVV